jgi:hypothetical protein
MLCALLLFLAVGLGCELLIHLLWLYEVRVHGAASPAGSRSAHISTFAADWAALVFASTASLAGLVVRSRPPDVSGAAERPVLLLHGWGATHGAMALLAARLRRDGRPAHSLRYSLVRAGLHAASASVGAAVADLGRRSGGRVDVVAHGSAGIVIRNAARNPACAEWLGNVVTLACPHQGTYLAAFADLHRLKWLRPASRDLLRLAEEDPLPAIANFITISSSSDAVVFPHELAAHAGAFNISVEWIGHYAMLVSERAYRLAKENLDVAPKSR